MSGSVTRAYGWNTDGEEQYIAASPSGDIVSLYQTVSYAKDEDENIVKVHEILGFEGIKAIQYSSATKGLTSVGQSDGKCFLFDISKSYSDMIRIKQPISRSCNSLSFNEHGLLAIGFDRSRSANSIQIYDVNLLQSGNGDCKSITSFVQNETVTSLSFNPMETTNFVAGSHKVLREFDTRSPNPIYQLATKCTTNITNDSYDQYIFASMADDGSLALWDRRKLYDSVNINKAQNLSSTILNEEPILQFSKLLGDSSQRKTSGVPYRFSSVRRGELSSLFDGELVRRWQICAVPPSNHEMAQYEELLQTSMEQTIPKPFDKLFVANVSDVKTKYERVISYDYAPSPNSEYGIELVCMRQSGNLYKMKVSQTHQVVKFNSYNDLVLSGPKGTLVKLVDDFAMPVDLNNLGKKVSKMDINKHNSHHHNKHHHKRHHSRNSKTKTNGRDGVDDESIFDEEAEDTSESEDFEFYKDGSRLTTTAVLENDICTTMRRRATLGYNMNSSENMDILDSLQTFETQTLLKNAWKWVNISHDLIISGKMSYGDFDFGYLGVLGIWNIENYYHNFSRYHGFNSITEKDILNAAKKILDRRTKEVPSSNQFHLNSKKEIQRRLAMYVIGWDFGISELEEKYKSLTKNGQYERAAGWAVFHNDVSRAVKILADSDNEKYKIMSTAIAAYHTFSQTESNNVWKEQCRELGGELEDPYLRAIFAFVADGNWWDVLDETALPLRERLGVALRFLPDSDLEVYLNRIAELVIERGEIEGIILTGITKRGADLLQSFVDRSSDIQSAALIASFACPKYFDDNRVDNWVDTYRSLLNSWGLFSVRARFDVTRSRLARVRDGHNMPKQYHKQLDIQCSNCHRTIHDDSVSPVNNPMPTARRLKVTVCQHCGFPLPRCAICLLTQGEPVPVHLLNTDHHRQQLLELSSPEQDALARRFKQWFSYCMGCGHSMHVGHAEQWFQKHFVCPVPECECKCTRSC